MKRTGKWIDGTTPEQPATEAAREAIRLRLKLVAHYLPLAAEHADEDREYVHQLRVATRRATAALKIFADLLPAGRFKWMKKRLRRIRQAAGDARDLDVLIARLEPRIGDSDTDPWRELVDELRQRRASAQLPIRKINERLDGRDVLRRIRGLERRVRLRGASAERDTPTFVEAARARLTPLANDFFGAICGPLDDLSAMHQCRIRGKKLRYAMEVFAGAFPPSFRDDLYPQIEQVQELLGEINDRATAHEHFSQWLNRAHDEPRRQLLRTLLTEESNALDDAREKFLGWWDDERAADLRGKFAELLGTPRLLETPHTAAAG